MRPLYNIYCDESCHIEHSKENVMVLGAVWCPLLKRQEIFRRIREIKKAHGLLADFEIKWHKVSPAKADFYLNILDYFFDDDDLHFRALVVPDKALLDHSMFEQTHDDFYYKMYFDLLKVILNPLYGYNIYLDIKDTRSQTKVEKLHQVLINSNYDFQKQIIQKVQQVHSKEIELLQLTDLLIGAVGYANRGLQSNEGKRKIVERIRSRSGYSLLRTTLYREDKVNIFVWRALQREAQ